MEAGPWIGVQRASLLDPAVARPFLERTVAQGARWLDVADVYGQAAGDAERLCRGLPCRVATKGGLVRAGARWRPDGRPKSIERAAAASVERLGVGALDLWQLHVPDPNVPFSSTLRAMRRLLDNGAARAVGLCNVTVGQFERAVDELPIASVQVELSPFRIAAVRSGIVEACRRRGVSVFGWRPLGGVDGSPRLLRHEGVRAVARRLGVTEAEVVLAWWWDLGITPVPGPTTDTHVGQALGAAAVALNDADRALLDPAFEAGRQLRSPRALRRPPDDAIGEVRLVAGTPGAGKSSRCASLEGFVRLNRDARGGTLESLLPALARSLTAGQRHVVLDNTYPSRASRNAVLEVAWRHGVPVTCEWLQTPDAEAEVNVIQRALERYDRLPELSDPDFVPPRALLRFREEAEVPTDDEGFARITLVPFERRSDPASERAVLFDPRDLAAFAPRLSTFAGEGYRPLAIGWAPGEDPGHARAAFVAEAASLGLEVDAAFCPHPAGPAVCWCRKPLPGLALLLIRRNRCAPERSVALVTRPADRSLAARLGVPVLGG